MRRAGEGSTDYNLTANSPLPNRYVILKNRYNKRELSRVLSLFNLCPNVTTDSRNDDAEVTMIAYMLQSAEFGKDVIRILSDDTGVFVMLVYWVWKMQLHCSVQMGRWNGVAVDINSTCNELGPKCLQLMGVHVFSGCDTVSYPFNKGKIIALNTLQAGDFPGLYQMLSEEDTRPYGNRTKVLRSLVWSDTRNHDE